MADAKPAACPQRGWPPVTNPLTARRAEIVGSQVTGSGRRNPDAPGWGRLSIVTEGGGPVACDAPIRECLDLHYAPHLAGAKHTRRGFAIQVDCPVCWARNAATISAGDVRRTVWHCHAHQCDGAKIRRAILNAGVPESCVPGGDGTETAQGDVIDAILTDTADSFPARLLRVHAIRRGYVHWPKGRRLVALAREVGVGRTLAYEIAAGSLLVPVPLTGSYSPPETVVVKSASSEQVSEVFSKAKESAVADKSAVADRQKSAVADSISVEAMDDLAARRAAKQERTERKGECPVCGRTIGIKPYGGLLSHGPKGDRCAGSNGAPVAL